MTNASSESDADWNLAEEVGGEEELHRIVREFYERLFADLLIGFMFQGHDLNRLVERQVEYLRARLGDGTVEYTGEPIRAAHESLPITVGHFDRRHEILRETLADWDVPDHVRERWVELDASLRDLVVRTGGEARERMLDGAPSQSDESDGEVENDGGDEDGKRSGEGTSA